MPIKNILHIVHLEHRLHHPVIYQATEIQFNFLSVTLGGSLPCITSYHAISHACSCENVLKLIVAVSLHFCDSVIFLHIDNLLCFESSTNDGMKYIYGMTKFNIAVNFSDRST